MSFIPNPIQAITNLLQSRVPRIVVQGIIIIATLNLSGCLKSKCPSESTLYGKLGVEVICMNGDKQRHGPNIRWHEGGEVKKYERSYSYNVLDGLYEEWYSNGQPKLRTVYDKGRLNGVYKIWYSNGQIKIQATYSGDQRVGSYKEFYRNGNPKTEYMYAPNGDFEGLQTTYRKNGFKISELTYIGGKKVGQKFWLPNGQADPVLYR